MTSYATLRDNANSTEDGLTPNTNTTPLTPPTLELASSVNNLTNNACLKKMNTPTTPNYDADSFSESEREKMDSTPENLKKIDDVIDNEVDGGAGGHNTKESTVQEEDQHHLHTITNNTSPCLSPRSEQAASFGLAAAVDDSNAKFCLAKPLCNVSKGKNNHNNKLYAKLFFFSFFLLLLFVFIFLIYHKTFFYILPIFRVLFSQSFILNVNYLCMPHSHTSSLYISKSFLFFFSTFTISLPKMDKGCNHKLFLNFKEFQIICNTLYYKYKNCCCLFYKILSIFLM